MNSYLLSKCSRFEINLILKLRIDIQDRIIVIFYFLTNIERIIKEKSSYITKNRGVPKAEKE